MLGYVVCDEGELLVKHQRLYRAAYCGLCHSMRKNRMKVLLPFFSYDFVFLSLIRLLVTGEEMKTESDFCLLHPFAKKKMRLAENSAFRYTSYAAGVLTLEKIKDEILDKDNSVFRRLFLKGFLPPLRHALARREKKDEGLKKLAESVGEILAQGRNLEGEGQDLDALSGNFGTCLSLLMSFGTEGKENRILSGIGLLLGKYIYVLDALDDLETNFQSGAFNPLLKNGVRPEKETLVRVDMVQAFTLEELKKIFDLTEGEPNLRSICENILFKGLPAQMRKICKPKTGETK